MGTKRDYFGREHSLHRSLVFSLSLFRFELTSFLLKYGTPVARLKYVIKNTKTLEAYFI